MEELKPCPFCGSTNISMSAFSVSADCYISCECGAMIEEEVSWEGCNTKEEHDKKCFPVLLKAWNTRQEENNEV